MDQNKSQLNKKLVVTLNKLPLLAELLIKKLL